MLARSWTVCWAALLICVFPLSAGRMPAAEKAARLTDEDKKFLAALVKDFLFDPAGAERVSVPVVIRTVWTRSEKKTTEGWLVAGKDGNPDRVFFIDGGSVPAPDKNEIKKIDFKSVCKALYDPNKKDREASDEALDHMVRTAVGALHDDNLVMAAWLFRLGEEELAAKALAAARVGKEEPRKRLRNDLAWSAFAGMVHAYMVRADEEALAHGERLLRLYPEEAKGRDCQQAARIVADLKRRQKKGTFGKTPDEKRPDGFDKWPPKKKADYWIEALDETDERQWGQPGGIDLASDLRVRELIRLGDAAVPSLIDAMEHEDRLTRSVHFWRDFARSRTVLGVREAELTALMSILRVRVFRPVSTGDNLTGRGDETAKDLVKHLRAYWKEYGQLPFDERMMRVLTDPKTSFDSKREAADNLASFGEERALQTTIGVTIIGDEPPGKPNRIVSKFDKPTVAEAILAAMDADLKDYDANTKDSEIKEYRRHGIEGTYLSALAKLGDKRMAPEMAKRSAGDRTIRGRRLWALVAHDLGDPKPFRSFVEDFRAGKILPPDDEEGGELKEIVRALSHDRTPEADQALKALADPKHPLHKVVTRQLLNPRNQGSNGEIWFSHPFCLTILRQALDDTTPTGYRFSIEEKYLWRKDKSGGGGSGVPEFLSDPAVRRNEADERACDVAAEKLAGLVIGLPVCHPMFKDADKRLIALKSAFDRFAGTYRRGMDRETELFHLSTWNPVYFPVILPLDRAATADDVKTGKAVFHLEGKGKPAPLKPPAAAVLKRDEKKDPPTSVLIVQAETGPDGRVTYGVILRNEIRAIPEEELTGIKTFAELEAEEKKAAEQRKKENQSKRKE
ncbi:hypothetical protein [Zavarzinella formosa]|uniref:hypothetical protein n=1 Tax=Zavarzinella formosa TaxID=360055 RepID=UPI0012FA634D|nr:hypothetical protein [Zavarzinella formosa]